MTPSIADPTAALMLALLGAHQEGRVSRVPNRDLRRRQRRYQRRARLRKLLG
jgi:hypothetical protein